MSKLKKILSTILVLCTVITCGFTKSIDAASVYGNTNSNISNGGYSAARGNYTYIRSSKTYKKTESSDYYYIHRTYKNGSAKKQIVNNAAEEPYINVVGNHMYYVGVYDSGNKLGIYRVNIDGTGKTRLIGNYNDNSIIVKDNYLYYIKETVNNNYDDVVSLCRYNLSTKKTVSTLYTTTTRYIDNMSLSGDYIYITAHGYENDIIYKINVKTKSRTIVYKYSYGEDDESYIDDMIYYKGNIYYTIYDDKDLYDEEDDTCQIYRISSSGKSNKRLSKYFTTGINLYNNKIYYINTNGSICSINLDGSARKTIKKASSSQWHYSLNISNSRMYFGRIVVDPHDIFEGILSDNIYRTTLSGYSMTII